jgi:mycoredoxin
MADDDGTLDIYWRPGCGYCGRLLRQLDRAGVQAQLHNIWEDDEALAFVRAHNRGNETVPTVALGGKVWTNPAPSELLTQLRDRYPHLVTAPDHAPGRWARLTGR